MKIYKPNRKGFINYLLIGGIILPIAIFFLDKDKFTAQPYILLPLLVPMILILWIYFGTSYKIENNKLFYRSAFLKGEIDISSIKMIVKGKTKWSGIKPAMAKNGLTITLNKYPRRIYIAPENNEEMISDLLKINSDILIKE